VYIQHLCGGTRYDFKVNTSFESFNDAEKFVNNILKNNVPRDTLVKQVLKEDVL